MDAYAAADFALVEGEFDATSDEVSQARGGSLDALCRMLDLPRLIVLDAAQAADCRIPARPDAVDGVLIDGIADYEQFFQIQTCLEGSWGVPVVGGLARDEGIRQAIASLPPGRVVPEGVCKALAASFAQFAEPRLLDAIVDRPALPVAGGAERRISQGAGGRSADDCRGIRRRLLRILSRTLGRARARQSASRRLFAAARRDRA
ncbi:MAG: hypothetical protein QM775_26050 [Pirellulales bacterium]